MNQGELSASIGPVYVLQTLWEVACGTLGWLETHLTVSDGRGHFLELPEKHPWQLHGWHDLHQTVPSVGGRGMLFLLCYSKGMRRIRKFWEAPRKFWRESAEALLASAICIKFISSNNTDADSESPAFSARAVTNLMLLTLIICGTFLRYPRQVTSWKWDGHKRGI